MPFAAPENGSRRPGGEVVTDLLHLLKEMENYIRRWAMRRWLLRKALAGTV